MLIKYNMAIVIAQRTTNLIEGGLWAQNFRHVGQRYVFTFLIKVFLKRDYVFFALFYTSSRTMVQNSRSVHLHNQQ